MTKAARQAEILKAIRAHTVRTQEDLASLLAVRGVAASQVTISRDLRELGLVKSPDGYREPGLPAATGDEDALSRALRGFLTELRPAQNLVVIKTNPGGAAAVALGLDRARWDEIVGTVAGDDTVFVATESARAAKALAERLRTLV